ncbi:MAG: fumarylacetoacetate hydrolase family protein [Candidatus Aminicenantes bacterium]|jgi:2-keto-4-pentenoate hydratase/2-oxohepta-3-ene-1,7-dioic acid hydratase in catechol pathway|nr:fumarylacetoacetate hydrolase family protein [Candidatus Aminicenantes bacterium]
MKIYRFKHKGKINHGILKEENLHPVEGSIFRKFRVSEGKIPISEVILLPPVVPSKIVAVGANYKNHVREMGRQIPEEPLIFLKPPSSVVGPNDIIIYPKMSKRVDYEGELALVIKKKTCLLKDGDDVEDCILGYTCFNDVTARDLQLKDGQFTRAKSFDTFASVGPCIATDVQPDSLRLKTFLNGKLKQSSGMKNLIFPVPFLVKFISCIMTLEPGDIITTGTPAGVGPMSPGDRVDVQIEGIGTLSNKVMKIKS